jgi:predicted RNase H-like nuclease (RuvC/YqgF family)
VTEPENPPETESRGVKFNNEINLGAILQAGVVLCGLVAWAITSANRSESAASGLTTLQGNVDKNMAALQVNLTAQNADLRRDLLELRQQIVSLPDQRARLDQLEHWRTDVEARFTNMDQHTGGLDRTTIETRAAVDNLLRAANVPLPARGR